MEFPLPLAEELRSCAITISLGSWSEEIQSFYSIRVRKHLLGYFFPLTTCLLHETITEKHLAW